MTDHEFKAPERTMADLKTCTECVEDAARLGAKVEQLLGERERARELAARLEERLTAVEAGLRLLDADLVKASDAHVTRGLMRGRIRALLAALTEAGGE